MDIIGTNTTSQHLIQTSVKVTSDAKKYRKSSWVMYFSAFTAHLLMVYFGSNLVWPSSVIPKLLSNDTEINPLGEPCTSLQISITVSIPCLAATLGGMVMGKLSDVFGRKTILFCVSISIICCLCILAFANRLYLYHIALFIQGLNILAIYTTVAVYNSEVADDNSRTLLGGFLGSALPVGIFLGYIYGATFFTVKSVCLVYTLPAILHLLLSYFIVESPVYLIRKNRRTEAIKTLEKLRRYSNVADVELEYNLLADIGFTDRNEKKRFLDLFSTRSSIKGLLISCLLFSVQQLSGITVIYIYMVPIFAEAGSALSAHAVSLLVGFVQMSVFIASAFIVNRFGRRPLLLLSCLGCSISMLLLTFYFYLQHIESIIINDIRWLPVLCIVLFVVVYGLGMGPVPVAVNAELFSNELRATGVAVAVAVDAGTAFILSFAFPLLTEAYGTFSCMLIYCISTFVGFIIFFFILPETKGKSFREIQDILSK